MSGIMPAEELQSRLYKEVEITETSLADQFFELASEIDKQLILHFNQHNFSFTMHLHRTFIYKVNEASNKIFTITGDDDVYLFIDNQLFIVC